MSKHVGAEVSPTPAEHQLLRFLDEQIIGMDAKVRHATQLCDHDYYRGWRDACFNIKNKLRELAGGRPPRPTGKRKTTI